MKNMKFAAAGIAVCLSLALTACSAAEIEFVHSTADANGKYTCEILGIGADFDTGIWTFYTDAEIASANGAASASNEDLKAALKKNAAIQDMVAIQDSGINVMIIYEDTNASKIGNVSEELYLNASKDQLESQFSAFMEDVSSEIISVTVAGESHSALDVSGKSYGETVYGRYICIRKSNLMGIISINAFSKAEINEITSMFYSL